MTLAIVVPVKSPERAKHRLAPLLSESERFELASAMARDVFRALEPLTEYGRVVVSEDLAVLQEASRFGLEPLMDQVRQGQSAAVQQGFSLVWERGITVALTVPGDVPGVTTGELRDLATYRPEIEVLLATDRARIGTNGLRLVPPHAITLRFGEDSFRLHRDEASRAHRSFEEYAIDGLRYDLDRPDDVAAFLGLDRETETRSLLMKLKIGDRVPAGTLQRG
ncbi:MAG TPA: 2-phospho-L-lactate guanylyltransferase [Candidatus Dormibacteraeota bacterium]